MLTIRIGTVLLLFITSLYEKLICKIIFHLQNIWHQDSIGSSIVSKEVVELVLACLKPTMERIAAEGLACKLKVSSLYSNTCRKTVTLGVIVYTCCN